MAFLSHFPFPYTSRFFGLVTQSSFPTNICWSQGNIPCPLSDPAGIHWTSLGPESLQLWSEHEQPKGKICFLCFRDSWGRKTAWWAQRMSAGEALIQLLPKGFTTGWAPDKLTGCDNDFAHPVLSSVGKFSFQKSSVQIVLCTCCPPTENFN